MPKQAPPPSSSASPLLGQASPRLVRRTVLGERLSESDTRGKVTVVKFFAEYCAPCRRSLPELAQLAKKHPDVAFLGVSLDDDPARTLAQMRRYGLDFPVVHDAGRVMAGRFRVTYLPMVFVIRTDGQVGWVGGPEQPTDALRRVLARAKTGSP
jgi:thiol-disulfide isomerase/thioredoxin